MIYERLTCESMLGEVSSRSLKQVRGMELKSLKKHPLSEVSEKPGLVFVYFLSFVDQLSRDLGALGLPLGQGDTAGLQNRFLFRACGYRQIIMNGLSYLKRSHTVTM